MRDAPMRIPFFVCCHSVNAIPICICRTALLVQSVIEKGKSPCMFMEIPLAFRGKRRIFAPDYKPQKHTIMKRIHSILALILMGLMSLVVSSCIFNDDDDYVATNLQGIWRGQIQSEYYYGRYGHNVEYTDTQIEFYSDPYSYARGEGREIDYSYSYYGDVVYFDYYVRDQVIYLDYSDGSRIAIYNWNLYRDTFTGEFHDYVTGSYLASFRLYRVSGSWDSSFRGYDWYDDWWASQHNGLFPDETDEGRE